jgi:hypothetical protein
LENIGTVGYEICETATSGKMLLRKREFRIQFSTHGYIIHGKISGIEAIKIHSELDTCHFHDGIFR